MKSSLHKIDTWAQRPGTYQDYVYEINTRERIRDLFCRSRVPYAQPDMGQAPFATYLQVYEQSEAQSNF